MIPVKPQKEPPEFDARVRKPGLQWLNENDIPLDKPPSDPGKLPPYWRRTQKELWDAYQGVCAYLCVWFDWDLGASTTDHFVAKSKDAKDAYEWENYRLSCLSANRNKSIHDVLDPFKIKPNTFILNLASGAITPNKAVLTDYLLLKKAYFTIEELKLNSPYTKRKRATHFTKYLRGDFSWEELKNQSPFVWYEAQRQGWNDDMRLKAMRMLEKYFPKAQS